MRLKRKNGKRVVAQFQLEWRDLWIGLFWRRTEVAFHVYVCFIPCVPFHVTIEL